MSDPILDVQEAMRRERLEKLWKTYGNYAIAFALLTVLIVAGIEAQRAWMRSAQTRDTEALMTLLDNQKFPDLPRADFDAVRGSARGAALLIAAGQLLKKDKTKEAADFYAAAADDPRAPPDLRGLAVLMRARLGAEKDALAALQPVLQDKRSPWRPYALIDAAAAARDAGDNAAANDYLKQAQETPDMPPGFYRRALDLSRFYAMRANAKDDKRS